MRQDYGETMFCDTLRDDMREKLLKNNKFEKDEFSGDQCVFVRESEPGFNTHKQRRNDLNNLNTRK